MVGLLDGMYQRGEGAVHWCGNTMGLSFSHYRSIYGVHLGLSIFEHILKHGSDISGGSSAYLHDAVQRVGVRKRNVLGLSYSYGLFDGLLHN